MFTGLAYSSKNGSRPLRKKRTSPASDWVGASGKLDGHPVAPLANGQQPLLGADDDLHVLVGPVEMRGELGLHLLRRAKERVVGAVERGAHHAVARLHLVHHAARQRLAGKGERLGGVEPERAVGAEEVGRPHAAQLAGGRARRREVRRHADDRGRHAPRLEQLPERLALAQQLHRAARQRQLPASEPDRACRALRLRRRQVRRHRLRIAMDEVEDAVRRRDRAR